MEVEGEETLTEIYKWIDNVPFSRPKRIIARDFSDAVLMAELLKRYYPKVVDIHNYIPGNSVAKKIDNWCTLNRKVLSKIGMKLGKEVIEQLANSTPGVIEKVLLDLHTKILKNSSTDRSSLYAGLEEPSAKEIGSILDPDGIANKSVPRYVFVKLKEELQEKDELINSLHRKVSHLESIMKLKEQRIADLSAQIVNSTGPNLSPRINSLESVSKNLN
ncbi:sperm flagellar protein 1-like isoform X2 [Prorops nasuta]